MDKTIKVEWTAEDVAAIAYEWLGKPISKAVAEKITARIQARAQEELSRVGFGIIADLVEKVAR